MIVEHRGLSRIDPATLGLKRARSDIVGAPVKVLRAPWVRAALERAAWEEAR